jgi:hypothetical protein
LNFNSSGNTFSVDNNIGFCGKDKPFLSPYIRFGGSTPRCSIYSIERERQRERERERQMDIEREREERETEREEGEREREKSGRERERKREIERKREREYIIGQVVREEICFHTKMLSESLKGQELLSSTLCCFADC